MLGMLDRALQLCVDAFCVVLLMFLVWIREKGKLKHAHSYHHIVEDFLTDW